MAVTIDKIATAIQSGMTKIQQELLEVISHFPWEEPPEGWYQFGLMRELAAHQPKYSSYPEYWLGHVGWEEGGKADLAVFEENAQHNSPSVLIEVKSVGSGWADIGKDAKRLRALSKQGKPGILAYITPPLEKSEQERTKRRFRDYCGELLEPVAWNSFKAAHSIRGQDEKDLRNRKWGVLIATFPIERC